MPLDRPHPPSPHPPHEILHDSCNIMTVDQISSSLHLTGGFEMAKILHQRGFILGVFTLQTNVSVDCWISKDILMIFTTRKNDVQAQGIWHFSKTRMEIILEKLNKVEQSDGFGKVLILLYLALIRRIHFNVTREYSQVESLIPKDLKDKN